MYKKNLIYLFVFIVISAGFEQNQGSASEEANDKPKSDKDKYETESRQDFDKTSEKGKELKILRKTQRLKESDYKRALESILPAKNSQGYRRFFDDLINDTDERSRSGTPPKFEEVVVTDTFVNGEPADRNIDLDSQVEEIEVVIEHITDDTDNSTNAKPANMPTSTESREVNPNGAKEPPKANPKEQEAEDRQHNGTADIVLNTKGRSGLESTVMEPLHFGRLEERKLLEPYPMSRISEVVIPHYRTTLTRNGLVVSPAVYTVQTSSPIVDHVTNQNWTPNRRLGPELFGRPGSNKIGRSDTETRSMDDYNDYESNAYSYSPSKLLTSRQGESKIDILSRLTEASLQPTLGNMKPYSENLYPGAYYPQPRYFSDSYRPSFRSRR